MAHYVLGYDILPPFVENEVDTVLVELDALRIFDRLWSLERDESLDKFVLRMRLFRDRASFVVFQVVNGAGRTNHRENGIR